MGEGGAPAIRRNAPPFSLVKMAKSFVPELWGIDKDDFQFLWITSTYFEGY